MLLEFKTKNYKCFKDEAVFSMMPAPKQKGLDYSLLTRAAGKKAYTALCSSVVYGANAAGKSNIVSAIQTFKSIVLHGNINNVPGNVPNAAENTLELIPNNSLPADKPDPVCFSIKFIDSDLLFDYSLAIDLGSFLDSEYKRSIKSEILKINEKDTVDVSAPEGYDITRAVDTETMCEFGFPDNESYTVRFYMGDKKSKGSRILTEDNGVLKEVEHRQDGEYIVFTMSEPGTFYLAKAKEDEIRDKAKIALAAAAGLIIVLLILWGLMKKKKQQRDPENGRK